MVARSVWWGLSVCAWGALGCGHVHMHPASDVVWSTHRATVWKIRTGLIPFLNAFTYNMYLSFTYKLATLVILLVIPKAEHSSWCPLPPVTLPLLHVCKSCIYKHNLYVNVHYSIRGQSQLHDPMNITPSVTPNAPHPPSRGDTCPSSDLGAYSLAEPHPPPNTIDLGPSSGLPTSPCSHPARSFPTSQNPQNEPSHCPPKHPNAPEPNHGTSPALNAPSSSPPSYRTPRPPWLPKLPPRT